MMIANIVSRAIVGSGATVNMAAETGRITEANLHLWPSQDKGGISR
jgi:hypothetical protein